MAERKPLNVTNLVIAVIVLLWAVSVVMGMIDKSYQIPSTVQITMGTVAAYLFGEVFLRRARQNAENKNREADNSGSVPGGDNGGDRPSGG